MILSKPEIEEYKSIQKFAYNTTLEIASRLEVGMTEKYVANLLDSELKKAGVESFFHNSFAWFHDRTSFTNFQNYFDFLPTDRKLEKGMAVILDTAPARKGKAVDIGYAFAFGENSLVEEGLDYLEVFRKEIISEVRKERTLSEIYKYLDQLILDIGYSNCHKSYPLSVLGHKIGQIPHWNLSSFDFLGFPIQSYFYLLEETVDALNPFQKIFSPSKNVPYWNSETNHLPEKGLWAVEPHISKDGVGTKWEEILVITESDVFWLDDSLPHTNRKK
ncbi:MAG: M24 family metallopeptidase [Leptospiraceae bacterium]|nr:M24 family metallopeptidase [Leptospiraceae bacterium]